VSLTSLSRGPPSLLHAELQEQARRITPRTPGSGIDILPAQALPSRDAAVAKARVIATHSGTLPNGFEDMLSGAVGTDEAERWIKENHKKIEGELFSVRFVSVCFVPN
jgi:hypothetical protein